MSFFIQKVETMADDYMNADRLMTADPDYYRPRFEAIAELRSIDDGSLHRGNEFRRVASLVNIPLANALNTVLDGEWMKDKNRFFAWLDRNREFCTYQRPTRAARAAQIERDLGNLGKEIPDGTP